MLPFRLLPFSRSALHREVLLGNNQVLARSSIDTQVLVGCVLLRGHRVVCSVRERMNGA
jgi:hypothetical protein